MSGSRQSTPHPEVPVLLAVISFLAFSWPMISSWQPELRWWLEVHVYSAWIVIIAILLAVNIRIHSRRKSEGASLDTSEPPDEEMDR